MSNTIPLLFVRLHAVVCTALVAVLLCGACTSTHDLRDANGDISPQAVRRSELPRRKNVDPDILYLKAIQAFEQRNYFVAETRFKRLHELAPTHFMTTAYLGLTHWFQGRPKDTQALWNAYQTPQYPGLEQALRHSGAELDILARMLRARAYLGEARFGRPQPLALGLSVVTPPVALNFGGQSLPVHALNHLLHQRLGQCTELRVLPENQTLALVRATDSDPFFKASQDTARLLAGLVGAEYAVSAVLGPSPLGPDTVRTRLTVTPTEDPGERLRRLTTLADAAQRRATQAELALTALDTDATRYEFAIKYHQVEAELSQLLAQRKALAQDISEFNKRENLVAAQVAVARYQALEAQITKSQQELNGLGKSSFGLSKAVFHNTLDDLTRRQQELAASRKTYVKRAQELRAKADEAYAKAARLWPRGGLGAEFDLSANDLDLWPGQAARHIAQILDVPCALPTDLAVSPDQLLVLDLALQTRDREEWPASREFFAKLPDPAPTLPSDGFHCLPLTELPPDQLAARYVDVLTRALNSARQDAETQDQSLSQFEKLVQRLP